MFHKCVLLSAFIYLSSDKELLYFNTLVIYIFSLHCQFFKGNISYKIMYCNPFFKYNESTIFHFIQNGTPFIRCSPIILYKKLPPLILSLLLPKASAYIDITCLMYIHFYTYSRWMPAKETITSQWTGYHYCLWSLSS